MVNGMFNLPIVINSRKVRKKKKLKYIYINALAKQFEQESCVNISDKGLPTPENSGAEASDFTDNTREIKSKKQRTRLKSILGESYLSSNDEYFSGDEGGDEIDPELIYQSRYHKPQYTYETWNFTKKNKIPLQKRITYYNFKKIQRFATKKVSTFLNCSGKSFQDYFNALESNYDIYPEQSIESFQIVHYHHLNHMLHLSILKNNWGIAYRCFSLIIRLKNIDIRSIWGLGSRILNQKNNTANQKFLEWMSTVFSIKNNFNQGTNYQLDPVFRSGSKTHTPKFVLTWLWTILIDSTTNSSIEHKQSINQLMERLSDMVLVPPYIDDSEIWFIYSLCHLIQADILSSEISEKLHNMQGSKLDISRNQVIQHIHECERLLNKCKEKKGFEFPENLISKQLKEFEKRLYLDHQDTLDIMACNNTDVESLSYIQRKDHSFEIQLLNSDVESGTSD